MMVGLEGRGIVASQKDILLEKYIGLVVVDRVTDNVIFQAEKAAVTNQQWQVRAKELMTGSFSFETIIYRNDFDSGS